MYIKLLDVFLSEKTDSKLIGYALVQLSDKMKVLMNIFKNKDGHVFLKFPASKIADQYRPHLEFINLNVERDISAVIGEEVAKKFSHSGYSSPTVSTNVTSDFPF